MGKTVGPGAGSWWTTRHDDGIGPPSAKRGTGSHRRYFGIKVAFGWAVYGKYRANAMIVIENVEQFGEWLEDKPPDVSAVFSAVFITRASLRIMPLVVGELDGRRKAGADVVMPVFRALAAAWTVGAWPDRATEAQDAARKAAFAAGGAEALSKNADAKVVASTVGYAADVAANAVGPPDAGALAARISGATGSTTTFWTSLQNDVATFEEARQTVAPPALSLALWGDGGARQAAALLARTSLWQGDMPRTLAAAWDKLKAHLIAADEGWDVWIGWYESRLHSHPEPDKALEVARVLIPDADWERGPAHVNRVIAELIEKHTLVSLIPQPSLDPPAAQVLVRLESLIPPPLPDPLPSPVRFEIRDEAVHKAPHPAPVPPDERRAGAESAWTALRQLLDDLAESSAGQNHPRIGRILNRCRSALGDEYQQMDVVMLGVHASRVDQIAQRADDILMEEDAANLVAFNVQLRLFLGQFPEWSEYERGIADRFGSDEAEQKAVSDASDAVQAMRHEAPDLLAPDAVDALTELEEEATPETDADDPGAPAPPANRRSFLRACRDLFVKLSDVVVTHARRGIERGIERHFEAATAGALFAASTWLLALATGLPAEFGWLSGIVTYLARILGASSNGRPKNGNPPSD